MTVPGPDLLRCYRGSETTTNQKRGGLPSPWLPLPPVRCCLLRAAACPERALFRAAGLPGGRTGEAGPKGGRPLTVGMGGRGAACVAGAPVPILSSQASGERKGFVSFFFFLLLFQEGDTCLSPASSSMAGLLTATKARPRSPGRRGAPPGPPMPWCSAGRGGPGSPSPGSAGLRGRAPSAAPPRPRPVLLLPLTRRPPLVFKLKEGALLAPSMPLEAAF